VKWLKDLLYNKDNAALDISRACSLVTVLVFLGLAIYSMDKFEPVAFGGGAAALFAGCAGWIFARQKFESGGGNDAAA
jgi:hypothetical protein